MTGMMPWVSQHELFMHNDKHAPLASVVCLHGKQRPEFDGRAAWPRHLFPGQLEAGLGWKQPHRKPHPLALARSNSMASPTSTSTAKAFPRFSICLGMWLSRFVMRQGRSRALDSPSLVPSPPIGDSPILPRPKIRKGALNGCAEALNNAFAFSWPNQIDHSRKEQTPPPRWLSGSAWRKTGHKIPTCEQRTSPRPLSKKRTAAQTSPTVPACCWGKWGSTAMIVVSN